MRGGFKRRGRQDTGVEASVESEEGREGTTLFTLHALRIIGCLLLISGVCVAAYANTFHVPLIWDDTYHISDNSLIRNLDNFTSSLSGYNPAVLSAISPLR
jgi:hypothetical protein